MADHGWWGYQQGIKSQILQPWRGMAWRPPCFSVIPLYMYDCCGVPVRIKNKPASDEEYLNWSYFCSSYHINPFASEAVYTRNFFFRPHVGQRTRILFFES